MKESWNESKLVEGENGGDLHLVYYLWGKNMNTRRAKGREEERERKREQRQRESENERGGNKRTAGGRTKGRVRARSVLNKLTVIVLETEDIEQKIVTKRILTSANR